MVSTLVTHIMSSVYRVRLSLPQRDSLPNQPSVNSTILTLILLISGDPVSVGGNTNTLMSVGDNTNTLTPQAIRMYLLPVYLLAVMIK